MNNQVPIQWFMKELLSGPLWLPNGRSAPWEPAGDDTGLLATNDVTLIFHLNNLAQRHVGGVVRIDEATYTEIKKKEIVNESPRRLQREVISGPTAAPARLSVVQPKPEVAAPVVADVKPPAPAAMPARVRVGKVKPTTVIDPV